MNSDINDQLTAPLLHSIDPVLSSGVAASQQLAGLTSDAARLQALGNLAVTKAESGMAYWRDKARELEHELLAKVGAT